MNKIKKDKIEKKNNTKTRKKNNKKIKKIIKRKINNDIIIQKDKGIDYIENLDDLYQYSINDSKVIKNLNKNSKNNIISDFFKDISNIKLLKTLEEKVLIKTINSKNKKEAEEAKKKILDSNLRLVISIAKKYFYFKGNEHNFLDIIFSGIEGLIKTLSKFDHTKDIKFSTYAYYWILQRIRRSCLIEESDLKIPVHHSELKNKIFLFKKKFFNEHHRYPTYTEIKKNFKISDKKLFYLLNLKKNFISIDATYKDKKDNNIMNMFIYSDEEENPLNKLINEEKKKHLNNILKLMDKRTKDIFLTRYGFEIINSSDQNIRKIKIINKKGKTLKEIGIEYDITTERVRQIIYHGLKKISKYIKENKLEEILKKNTSI